MFSIFTSSVWIAVTSVVTTVGGIMTTLTVLANHLGGKNKEK